MNRIINQLGVERYPIQYWEEQKVITKINQKKSKGDLHETQEDSGRVIKILKAKLIIFQESLDG